MPFNIKAPGSGGRGGGLFLNSLKQTKHASSEFSKLNQFGCKAQEKKAFPVFSCFSLHAFGVETCSREDTSYLNKHIDG